MQKQGSQQTFGSYYFVRALNLSIQYSTADIHLVSSALFNGPIERLCDLFSFCSLITSPHISNSSFRILKKRSPQTFIPAVNAGFHVKMFSIFKATVHDFMIFKCMLFFFLTIDGIEKETFSICDTDGINGLTWKEVSDCIVSQFNNLFLLWLGVFFCCHFVGGAPTNSKLLSF